MKKITTGFVYFLAILIIIFAGCKKKTKKDIAEPTSSITNDKIKKILVNGTHLQRYYFSYQENGMLSQIIAKGIGDWDTTMQIESNYTFGPNNNLVSATASYNNPNVGSVKTAFQYSYDNQNRLVLIQGSENGGSMYDLQRFYYNDNNKTIVNCNYDDSQGKYITEDSTIYFSYDSFGNPDSSTYYFSPPSATAYTQSRYTYDGFGNFLKKEYRQPSVSTTWATIGTCEYEVGNAFYYPKELFYFVLILGDDSDILDPSNNLAAALAKKETDYENCNSNAYTLITNSTFEKDDKGRITHMVEQGQTLNYTDCSTTNYNGDWTFYY